MGWLMLISFSVSNWRLFRDEVMLSMVATSERQHKDSITNISSIDLKVLPIAAIYGGNASGKTSFIRALAFVQEFIVRGTLPGNSINTSPFKLDPVYLEKPSHFITRMVVGDNCYEFSFAVDRRRVVTEKLVQILKTTEKELYSRDMQNFKFNTALEKDERLNFLAQGTRENQLFLTNSVSQNIQQEHEVFGTIYDWFRKTLTVIEPGTRFQQFERLMEGDAGPLSKKVNELLPLLNTGIAELVGAEIPIENLSLPPDLMDVIKKLPEKNAARINFFGELLIIYNEKGIFKAKKLTAVHRDINGNKIPFDMRDESDGTLRIIDLLPFFIELASQKHPKVYIVDEVDRSFHTEVLIELLKFFLDSCSDKGRSQLLFTTHDLLTMDQGLLRRDEMWVTERTQENSASLISFAEYKDIRNDKDIRKSYRQGRLGGLPKINLNHAFLKGADNGKSKA